MAKYNITPPDLNDCKSYEAFKRELSAWSAVTDLAKSKQGNFVILSLPNKSKFGNDIKERAFESLAQDSLCSEDGLKYLIDFLDKELGKNAVDDVIEKWEDFDNCKKSDDQALEDFIADFEAKYNRIKTAGTNLPEEVLAYMLLKRAGLTHIEKMLIISRIDMDKKEVLFRDVKCNMKNILGKRLQVKGSENQIKLEPAFLAQNEDVLAAHGFYRNRSGAYQNKFNKSKKGQSPKFQDKNRDKDGKKINPKGKDGKPMLCNSCGSFRHLMANCPDSLEKRKKISAYVTETVSEDSEVEPEPEQVNRFILFTSDAEELSNFTAEAINAAALDTCCTTSVAGRNWLNIYLKSLPQDYKHLVEGPFAGEKWFQFGNQGVLKSTARYNLPAKLGSTPVTIKVEIIESDIPLLLSKESMKKAGMIIHLSEDTAVVFGQKLNLNTTSAGHYVIPLLPSADVVTDINKIHKNEIFVSTLTQADESSKYKMLEKLHKQFGHRPKESFIKLLKDADSWSKDMTGIIDKIIDGCEGCIKRKRNPDRPAVAMPLASEFNEKLAIDLSFYKDYTILHMIDMWSRLSVATVIKRKKPCEVIEGIMQKWIAYYGTPGSILNDNGGEFTSEEIREVKSILNIHDLTTGAESPWQNGLCEKNHALLDNILERIDEDYPEIDINTKLAWAGMAKNSLQMTYGYSPNQLVFGKNPHLPNVLTDGPPGWEEQTASEMIAKHLNTLHAARRAFIQSESATKIKTALKAKIRTNLTVFEYGDVVYYKRTKDERWMGPAKVIFQDGKVIFVRHGSTYIRVSANRLVKAGQELAKKSEDLLSGKREVSDKNISKTKEPSSVPEIETLNHLEDEMAPEQDLSDENMLGSPAAQENVLESEPSSQEKTHNKCEKISLSKGTKIKIKDGDEWKNLIVTGRGKVTGKYRNWFNVTTEDLQTKFSVNLEEMPYEKIEDVQSPDQVFAVLIPKSEQNNEECLQAKMTEIQKLKDFDTFKLVDNEGQDFITCTWVISKKDDSVRARLVARGYEEEENIQSDSPTLSKAGLRLVITVAASKNWLIETTDIKSAFLQGSSLKRKVFIKPPKEADSQGKLWELKKALYGLKDASRQWYFKVYESLIQLGSVQSKFDAGIFLKFSKNGDLQGLIGLHVDDFLHAGDAIFNSEVIAALSKQFQVGKNEKRNFLYTGFEISQEDTGIRVNQNTYVQNLTFDPVEVSRAKDKKSDLTNSELTLLRKMAGALNWVVRGSRPDLSFELIDISTKFTCGKIEDLVRATKVIAALREKSAEIVFPNLGSPSQWKIVCYSDASLGNLNNGVDSTGGHLVFIVNHETGKVALAEWQANKIRRVVRSTLAAETLSLCDGLETAIFVNGMIEEIFGKRLGVHAVTDNRSVVEAINSTTMVDDKRLRREISAIKEMLSKDEVCEISWVPGREQLADVLTKRGVNGCKLLQVIQSGKFH